MSRLEACSFFWGKYAGVVIKNLQKVLIFFAVFAIIDDKETGTFHELEESTQKRRLMGASCGQKQRGVSAAQKTYERMNHVKRRILVLLLALAMLCGMLSVASAATDAAGLHLSLRYEKQELVVTLSLSGGAGVSNGRVCLSYDAKAAQPKFWCALAECGAGNFNAKTEGKLYYAWVGSSFTEETTELLEVRFAVSDDLNFSAQALELYAGQTKLTASDAGVSFVKNPFTDIETHWAKEEILKATYAGLFQGETQTKFAPARTLTRAMFVTVLHRLAGQPEAQRKLIFTDLEKNGYYLEALAWATENGIVTGRNATTFSPDDAVTRQEMAAMLYRYAKLCGEDVSARADLSKFSDRGAIDAWALDAMSWCVARGLLKGYPNGTLKPFGCTTRAEAAVVFCRLGDL